MYELNAGQVNTGVIRVLLPALEAFQWRRDHKGAVIVLQSRRNTNKISKLSISFTYLWGFI